jgi:hypothetical protein
MKIRFILIMIVLSLAGFSHATAQLTFAGAAVDYGTGIKEPGFSALAYYTVNEQIDLAPNITYYLTHKERIDNEDKKTSWLAFNLDGHYNIFHFGAFEGFGVMGLNFTYVTTETLEIITGTEFKDRRHETKAGLNVGFGGSVHLSRFFIPFTEFKYTLEEKKASQANLRVGLIFRIMEDKERDFEEY